MFFMDTSMADTCVEVELEELEVVELEDEEESSELLQLSTSEPTLCNIETS